MPEVPQIPLDTWIDALVRWLRENVSILFDGISDGLGWLIDHLEDLLLLPPEVLLAAIFGGIAWWLRSLGFGVFTFASFLLIQSMRMWEASMSTLSLVLVATLVAVALGVPTGIWAARNEYVSQAVRPVLDFMQTMPAFVYLVPAIFFFGIGKVPGTVATIVFAMPPAVRLTELGIRQVDKEVVEAGDAFGARPLQILRKIQIPLALPTIMAGVNQVIMLSLSMVVIAGMVGAGGLGGIVFRSITRLNVGLGFEGGLAVVILAIFLDRVTAALGKGSGVQMAGTA